MLDNLALDAGNVVMVTRLDWLARSTSGLLNTLEDRAELPSATAPF
jgi:hypothetical protein